MQTPVIKKTAVFKDGFFRCQIGTSKRESQREAPPMLLSFMDVQRQAAGDAMAPIDECRTI